MKIPPDAQPFVLVRIWRSIPALPARVRQTWHRTRHAWPEWRESFRRIGLLPTYAEASLSDRAILRLFAVMIVAAWVIAWGTLAFLSLWWLYPAFAFTISCLVAMKSLRKPVEWQFTRAQLREAKRFGIVMERDGDWRPQVIPLVVERWQDYLSTFRDKVNLSVWQSVGILVIGIICGVVTALLGKQFWILPADALPIWIMLTVTMSVVNGLFLPSFIINGVIGTIGARRRDTRDRVRQDFDAAYEAWLAEEEGTAMSRAIELTRQIALHEDSLAALKNNNATELERILTEVGAWHDGRLAALHASQLHASRGATESSNLMALATLLIGLLLGLVFRNGAPWWIEVLLGAAGAYFVWRSLNRNTTS